MGNVNANGTSLAMMAVARSLRLQRFQIIMMRETLKAHSDESGFVDKAGFDFSLSRSKITQPGALEIFELLFTMWDYFEVQRIPAKKFAVGIAPLACSCDDIASVLRFSLHISDERDNGRISPRSLHDVLISIDNTASYFGDAHLEPGDIDSVVEAVFEGRDATIPNELCVRKLQNNAYIKRFISGKIRPKVQFNPEVEITSVFCEEMPNPCLTPTPKESREPSQEDGANLGLYDGEESFLDREHFLDRENFHCDQLCDPISPKRSGSGLDESWASFVSTDTSKSGKDPPSTVFVHVKEPNANPPLAPSNWDPPSFEQ